MRSKNESTAQRHARRVRNGHSRRSGRRANGNRRMLWTAVSPPALAIWEYLLANPSLFPAAKTLATLPGAPSYRTLAPLMRELWEAGRVGGTERRRWVASSPGVMGIARFRDGECAG